MQVKFLMAATHPTRLVLSPSQAWPRQKTCNVNILREKLLQVISVYLRIIVKEEPSRPSEMLPRQVATTHVSKSYVPKPPGFFPSQSPGPVPSGAADPGTHLTKNTLWAVAELSQVLCLREKEILKLTNGEFEGFC